MLVWEVHQEVVAMLLVDLACQQFLQVGAIQHVSLRSLDTSYRQDGGIEVHHRTHLGLHAALGDGISLLELV